VDTYLPHHSLPANYDGLLYHTFLSCGKVNADALGKPLLIIDKKGKLRVVLGTGIYAIAVKGVDTGGFENIAIIKLKTAGAAEHGK
jgi:hypothetical protein